MELSGTHAATIPELAELPEQELSAKEFQAYQAFKRKQQQRDSSSTAPSNAPPTADTTTPPKGSRSGKGSKTESNSTSTVQPTKQHRRSSKAAHDDVPHEGDLATAESTDAERVEDDLSDQDTLPVPVVVRPRAGAGAGTKKKQVKREREEEAEEAPPAEEATPKIVFNPKNAMGLVYMPDTPVTYGASDMRNPACLETLFRPALSQLKNLSYPPYPPVDPKYRDEVRMNVEGLKVSFQRFITTGDGTAQWMNVVYGEVRLNAGKKGFKGNATQIQPSLGSTFIGKEFKDISSVTWPDGTHSFEVVMDQPELMYFPVSTSQSAPPPSVTQAMQKAADQKKKYAAEKAATAKPS